MKKLISLVLVLVLSLGAMCILVGCQDEKDDNVLRVGMEVDYKPFNWEQTDDSNGAVKITKGSSLYANGYDVMIAKAIAEELGKTLEIHKMEWDSLTLGVQAGTIDCIIAGMSPIAERKKIIDFTDAYYTSNLVIVVRKGSQLADCTTLSEVKALSANVVAQRNTFHAVALEQLFTVKNENLMADFPTMIMALNANNIDGYISEEPGAIVHCLANENLTYVKLTNNDNGFTAGAEDTQIAVGVAKSSELLTQINEVLAGISQSDRDDMMELAFEYQAGL